MRTKRAFRGCLKPQGSHSKLHFYQLIGLQLGPLALNLRSWTREAVPFLSANGPLPIFLLLSGARMWDYGPLEAVWTDPSAFLFHHLSVYHLNHQSELSAPCHLTAFSPSEAIKGTLNASPDKKLTPRSLILHCWKAVPDHSLLITDLTEQYQSCSSRLFGCGFVFSSRIDIFQLTLVYFSAGDVCWSWVNKCWSNTWH